MSTATAPTPQLLRLSELQRRGYGSKQTLMKKIRDGEIPAVRVGNIWKVDERDLRLLAVPTGGTRTAAPVPETGSQAELADLAARLVATFPRLTADQRTELGRILSAA